MTLLGNVGTLTGNVCEPGVTHRYNVWTASRCDPTDRRAAGGFVRSEIGNADLHLRADSPARGRGDPGTYPRRDIDGDRRPLGDRPDAGADERP